MDTLRELFDFDYIDNEADNTLFLLHGTGGGKTDFLFLNNQLNHRYNLVGIEGNVLEQGMRRFFKRIKPGVFDEESILLESDKLQRFFTAWKESHPPQLATYYLGYSNGANMLLATLLFNPHLMNNLVLLHSMMPLKTDEKQLDLSDVSLFLSHGIYDDLIPYNQQQTLTDLLISSKAKVTVKEYAAGHEITSEEMRDVINYVKNN